MKPDSSPGKPTAGAHELGRQDRLELEAELLRLVEHSIWANRQWVDFVYSRQDSETRPRELLGHLMVGERVWFERVTGEQKTREMFPVLGKEELLQGFEENRRTLQDLIAARLTDVIDFKRGAGEEYHARAADILYHLLTHGYHHRGQLAAHYAKMGVEYPNTDHIHFLIKNKI